MSCRLLIIGASPPPLEAALHDLCGAGKRVTDARCDQKGLIGMADGGTLLLDEIDSLSAGAQVKLLRFLQERSYRPLGADRFVQADVSLIAATNRDLESLVREREFRSDLYFRLNVLRLHLTPLRERPIDIPIPARYFVNSLSAETGARRKTLAPGTLQKLSLHDWSGSVRELFNILQRAFLFSDGPQILPSHVLVAETERAPERVPGGFRQARAQAIEAFEKSYVNESLRRWGGNITRAARDAQKDRRAFGRLVKKYKINRLGL
jgi:DNA-binding NtrC family response regulator